ncbi:MBL fold metallo-hydrolase [bacterium]|nr:MBL fold metallo-hydrolase [bacterium]
MGQPVFSEILGNSQKLDGGAMFGNAPRTVWEKWMAPDELGRIPLACRALLIEFEDKKILFEAGIGAFFEPKLAERFGVQEPQIHKLNENLKKLAINPDQITHVILSHLHFDHAGGILPSFSEIQNGNNGLVFNRAEYITSTEAFARAQNPHSRDKASFIPGLVEKLESTGRLRLLQGTEKLFNGRLEFILSQGHTPGQLHSLFHGDQNDIFFCGDLIPGIPWVHTAITMGYDRFPEQLINEKQGLYQKLDLQKTYFYFTHDVEFAAAKVSQDSSGKFLPQQQIKNPVRQGF